MASYGPCSSVDVLPVIGLSLVILLPLLEVGLGKEDLMLVLDLMKDGCLLLEVGRPNVLEGHRLLPRGPRFANDIVVEVLAAYGIFFPYV